MSPLATDHEELMGLLRRAVCESVQILQSTDEPFDIWMKKNLNGKDEVVTSKDVKIEQCFREHLLTRYPHATILSEEADLDIGALRSPLCFVLDPIDGTQQYINGSPHFAISVAAVIEGQLSHGIVAYPSSNVILGAIRGGGATIGDKMLSCPSGTRHGPIRLGISPSESNTLYLAELCSHLNDIKISVIPTFTAKAGAIALQALDVALYFAVFGAAYIWDYAAIALVLEEAGYSCTDITGNRLSQLLPFVHRKEWIAGVPNLLTRFYHVMRELDNNGGLSLQSNKPDRVQ